ncbi:outer surface protein [Labrys miyagiensis]|uniref:Outer surface protein n=1 Tax=Labrys miyagiensis TaxID=346912 RepID=A0ABQ6CI64_9HYPH|nr:outer membrane beta-barrel protein [Labrys miyagiensis]GLS20028.1 outer surface protein [Labrys miyagiensis]
MRRLAWPFLATLAVLAAPTLAQAGLLPPLPALDETGSLDDGDSGANWYLRGSAGVSLPASPSLRPYTVPGVATRGEVLHAGWAVGGAVGYQWGWLRSDISLDYLGRRDFSERFTGACGTGCSGTLKGEFSAVPVLANFYYDIGTWKGLTPYLGAGLGVAHLHWDDLKLAGQCNGPCPAASGEGHWRFAWQVGAGVSYAVSEKVTVDADYRLLDLGKAGAGSTATGSVAADTIWDNELRISLRYKLN